MDRHQLATESLREHNGMGAFVVLIETETREIIGAKQVEGKYGRVWCLDDNEQLMFGEKWVPYDASHTNRVSKRSTKQHKLGVEQAYVVEPARVSRDGDIIRVAKEWPAYGRWQGIPDWGPEDNFVNEAG